MRAKGFTLIELLLVVVIITVLCGLAVPSVNRSFRQAELDQDANQVYCLAQYLQELSVQENRIYYLGISTENPEFTPSFKDEKGALAKSSSHALSSFKTQPGVSVEVEPKGIAGVYFYPDASMDKAGIRFGSASGQRLVLLGGANGSVILR